MGEGAFGKVFKCYCRRTNRIVAVKQIEKREMQSADMELCLNEIEILKVLNHDNVIRLIDVFENEKSIYMVLEYINGSNLMEYSKKNFMGENRARTLMRQVFYGVKYFHEIGIAHRDIKLENIMVAFDEEKGDIPKLIDFGLSKVFLPNETSSESYGSLVYCSPEILLA